MENDGDWKIISGKAIYYPESFRIKVVKEVESGILSKEGARRKYGIRGKTTVLSWCRCQGPT